MLNRNSSVRTTAKKSSKCSLLLRQAPIVAILMLAAGLITSSNSSNLKNQNVKIEVGESYIFSLDWGNEDPFRKIEIDTVKVVAIKDDYVQWQYKKGYKLSGKLKYFKHGIKL